MSETATIQIVEGIKKDNGWYEIKDSNDLTYSTKKASIGDAALALSGKTALVEFKTVQKDDFTNRYIDAIKAAENGSAPTAVAQGTRAKEAPETRAGISASVALKEAVNTAAAFEGREQSLDSVLEAADYYFDWLMSKTASAAPEKASSGATGASQEPATEGQIKEISQWIILLDNDWPASPDPNWRWTQEAQRYVKANFGHDLVSKCSKAEAEQVRAWLETRRNERAAEEKLAF